MKRRVRPSRNLRSFRPGSAAARPGFRTRFEPLEDRQMLSVSDVLVATYDDTAGMTVLRYNEVTHDAVPGGVATGNNGLAVAQGIAVVADGSFYVSSGATAQVLHYDADGTFLDVLGGGDATPATFFAPGTIVYDPAENDLWVAELGVQAIYKFNLEVAGQQWDSADSVFLSYAPGGFNFSDDVDHELIVGGLFTQEVTRYNNDMSTDVLIDSSHNINPLAVLPLANGDVLVSDSDLGTEPNDHHRIVRYDASDDSVETYINLTFPVGTGMSAGLPPQPTGLLLDNDGNLLVALAPDHNMNGAVQKYDPDLASATYLETIVSSIGAPTALALTPSLVSTVAGRHLFYNNSAFDSGNASINVSDDAAIAPDKNAYLPGDGLADFDNVSSYSRGINGIVIDLAGGGDHASITLSTVANDFVFKVGNNNTPSSWSAAPTPSAVSVRVGAGVSGSDRLEITWADGAIANEWLEVQVLPTSRSGLTATDVFFWGNKIGDIGSPTATSFTTTAAGDANAIVAGGLGPAGGITNVRDIDRSNVITAAGDRSPAIANIGAITRIDIGTGGPFAPEDGDAGIASALSATSADSTGTAASASVTVAMADSSAGVAASSRSASAAINDQAILEEVESDPGDSDLDELLAALNSE